jgi:hypothetical protein
VVLVLGGRAGAMPSVTQLCALAIPPARAVYVRTLLQEIAGTPGAGAWMHAIQAR